MATIQARVEKEEKRLIQEYARFHGASVSSLIRTTLLDKIEEELDRKAFEQAWSEHQQDPVTYSIDEIEKELGLGE